jgi:hypothetical protein
VAARRLRPCPQRCPHVTPLLLGIAPPRFRRPAVARKIPQRFHASVDGAVPFSSTTHTHGKNARASI